MQRWFMLYRRENTGTEFFQQHWRYEPFSLAELNAEIEQGWKLSGNRSGDRIKIPNKRIVNNGNGIPRQ